MIDPNSYMWATFIIIGLLAILLELFVGVEAGFDLVMLGSAFIIGGISTCCMQSWMVTAAVVSVICMVYIVFGRGYVKSRLSSQEVRTNVDALIGMSGVAEEAMNLHVRGSVKISYESWRARTEGQVIGIGDRVTVTGVTGVTLIVTKVEL